MKVRWFMNYWKHTVGAAKWPNRVLHSKTCLMLPEFKFYAEFPSVYIL